jgi:hypothetical protein
MKRKCKRSSLHFQDILFDDEIVGFTHDNKRTLLYECGQSNMAALENTSA